MKHDLELDPKTWAVACSCGERFQGVGCADRAESHRAFALSPRGRRRDRLALLVTAHTTGEFAAATGLDRGGAYAALQRLHLARLVEKRIAGGYQRKAYWIARPPAALAAAIYTAAEAVTPAPPSVILP